MDYSIAMLLTSILKVYCHCLSFMTLLANGASISCSDCIIHSTWILGIGKSRISYMQLENFILMLTKRNVFQDTVSTLSEA